MKRFVIFILLLFCAIGTAYAVVVETLPPSTQQTRFDYAFRADSKDSLTYRINGVATDSTGADSSGIFYAWKNTTFQFDVTGDSVNIKIVFKGGYTGDIHKSPTENDTTEFKFEKTDSLTITSAGTYFRTPTDVMGNCKMLYYTVEGLAGNGSSTQLNSPIIYRDRW